MNIFPDFLARQAKGGPKFLTSIVEANNGIENRYIKRPFPLSQYLIENVVCNEKQIEEIVSFFRITQGRAKNFCFKDYFDYKASNQILTFVQENNYQLVKKYGPHTSRIINHPIEGSVRIYVNEEEREAVINPETGIINVDASIEDIVTADFEFYTITRFDQDELFLSYKNQYIIESLKLVEVRDVTTQ